jgi:hypothetical protein
MDRTQNYTSGTAISFIPSISGNVLSITSSSVLAYGTVYQVILHSNCVTDLAGNGFVGPYGVKFTTTTPPVVTSTDPVNKAVNVALNKVIKITFNKTIQFGTNPWIELKNNSLGTAKPITTTITGSTLNITPTTLMSKGTTYTVILHSGCVTDTTGSAGFVGPYSTTFTTTKV